MPGIIGDPQRVFLKPYRDHMPNIPRELKVVQKGFCISDQDDAGRYVVTCAGAETCWLFWPARRHKKTVGKRIITPE